MVDLYMALIVNKRRTIDQVPAQFKTAVMEDLTALGLDGYGNPVTTENSMMGGSGSSIGTTYIKQ